MMRKLLGFVMLILSSYSGAECLDMSAGGGMNIVQKIDAHTYAADIWFLGTQKRRVVLKTTSTEFDSEGHVSEHLWISDKGIFDDAPEMTTIAVQGFTKTLPVVRETAACIAEGAKIAQPKTEAEADAAFWQRNKLSNKSRKKPRTKEDNDALIEQLKAKDLAFQRMTDEEKMADCKKRVSEASLPECVAGR